MLKLAGECIEGQLADHIANFDAHSYQLMDKLRTEKTRYWSPFMLLEP